MRAMCRGVVDGAAEGAEPAGMILSHRHRFVILQPWKTASSTVRVRLGHLDESPHPGFYGFSPWLNRVVHQHLTLAEFEALPEAGLEYVRAAFVRNPYDRVYSGFRQVMRDIETQARIDFPVAWVGALVRAQLAENYAALAAAGFDFDAWVAGLREYAVREVGRNSSLPLHPAHYWTHVGGVQKVDFVGRVEAFEADFAGLCGRLGVVPASDGNANLGEALEAAAGSRYVGRMAPASVAKINALFAEDFAIFGYETK